MKGLPSGTQDVSHGPLLDLLMGEIVPRLARAQSRHRIAPNGYPPADSEGGSPKPAPAPRAEQRAHGGTSRDGPLMLESQLAQALCAHAVQGDFRQAGQLIAAERSAGRSLVSILLELIQPAARELGRGWDSDTLSFAEVTVASGVLRRLMAEELGRSPSSAATRAGADPAPSAMFVALPGCQHRIGLGMIGAIFGLAGWRTAIADDQPLEPLLRRIVHFKPALLGLSLGSDFELERASEFILRVRHVSDRSNPVIMVGGPAVILRPDTAAALGADLVGGDALDALKQAARRLEEPRFESV